MGAARLCRSGCRRPGEERTLRQATVRPHQPADPASFGRILVDCRALVARCAVLRRPCRESLAARAADSPCLPVGRRRAARLRKEALRPDRYRGAGGGQGAPVARQECLEPHRRRRRQRDLGVRIRAWHLDRRRHQAQFAAAVEAAARTGRNRAPFAAWSFGRDAGPGNGDGAPVCRERAEPHQPPGRKLLRACRRHDRAPVERGLGRAADRDCGMARRHVARGAAAPDHAGLDWRIAEQPAPGRKVARRILQRPDAARRPEPDRSHAAPDRRRVGDPRSGRRGGGRQAYAAGGAAFRRSQPGSRARRGAIPARGAQCGRLELLHRNLAIEFGGCEEAVLVRSE